jgi:chemotaxis signal transduction protein
MDDAAIRTEEREAVVFMLAGQRYALPIGAVQEIQQICAMSEVPETSPGIIGMINLRGLVIPAVDLRRALGMEALAFALQTPMVIARIGGDLVALVVDEVEDVAALPEGCIQPPGDFLDLADRLIGVCRLDNELVFLLDPARLLARNTAKAKRRTRKKSE